MKALNTKIAGLFRQYFATYRNGITACPEIRQGVNGEYTVIKGRQRVGPGNPVRQMGDFDPHRQVKITFKKESIRLETYDGGMILIPDQVARAIAMGQEGAAGQPFSVVERSMMEMAEYFRDVHEETMRQAVLNSLEEVTAFNFQTDGDASKFARYLAAIREHVRQNSGGARPEFVWMAESAWERVRQLDEFQVNGVSIAGDNERRAGGTERAAQQRLFEERTGLTLMISDAQSEDAQKKTSDLWGDIVWLGRNSGGEVGPTTFKTCLDQPGELFNIETRPAPAPYRVGLAMTNEGTWQVHPIEPETGAFFRLENFELESLGSPAS